MKQVINDFIKNSGMVKNLYTNVQTMELITAVDIAMMYATGSSVKNIARRFKDIDEDDVREIVLSFYGYEPWEESLIISPLAMMPRDLVDMEFTAFKSNVLSMVDIVGAEKTKIDGMLVDMFDICKKYLLISDFIERNVR